MFRRSPILLTILVAGVATGQWLETTIEVGERPCALCYSPRGNKVYCANEGSRTVTVVDGETNSVLKTIPLGDGPYMLCYNSVNDRVYCCYVTQQLAVIDCAIDAVVRRITLPGAARDMCYNEDDNRVYCALWPGEVLVIDCAADTVLARITTAAGTQAVCYNRVSGKVYAASADDRTVMVIDCLTNIVRATLRVTGIPSVLGCNPLDNKVYCRTTGSVTIIDGVGDTIRAVDTVTATPDIHDFCFNHTDDKAYFSWDWAYFFAYPLVSVYDGRGDTFITDVALPYGYYRYEPLPLCYNSQNNKVYCGDCNGDTVYFIDGVTNRIVGKVKVPAYPVSLAWNTRQNRTYVSCRDASQVAVLRDTLVQNVSEMPRSRSPAANALPTIVRGSLIYQPTVSISQQSAVLFDLSGRRVMSLHQGQNDIRHVAPGVYFLRSAECGDAHGGGRATRSPVRKVVVQR